MAVSTDNATGGPASDAAAVTLSDSTVLDNVKAIYVGTAGDGTLRVTTAMGNVVNFAGIPAAFILPLAVTKVHNTGTGVSNVVALKGP